jgi:carbamoylphosphate synthase large subunit
VNTPLPIDLWGWKQGREADRREAPTASALIHQNRNNGIEFNSPPLWKEFKAEQERKAVDEVMQIVPSRLRKKMFAVRLKVEWMVKTYGVSHVGLQTMTIRENVTDRKEFERRFKSIATNGYMPA